MKEKSADNIWFEEFADVQETLLHITKLVSDISTDPKVLKWIVLASHNALQGMCVCYLTRSDNLGALEENSEKESLIYWYGGNEEQLNSPPREKLANLLTLLNRLPERFGSQVPKSLSLCKSKRQKNLFRLNHIRNGFVHFVPQYLALEKRLVILAVIEALETTHEVAASDDFANRNRFDKKLVQDRIGEAIDQLSKTLKPRER